MLTKVRYSLKDVLLWTRLELMGFIAYGLLVAYGYGSAGLSFFHLPWAPLAILGTAVAFIVGFQNNAAYGRIWEARKIWGGIVNASRSWGMKTADMVSNEHATAPGSAATPEELSNVKRTLVYRHIAWLTALRHAMRQTKPWEQFARHWTNREWGQMMHIPERVSTLEDDLVPYLSAGERASVLKRTNRASAILLLQSHHLRELKERGLVWEFSFLELENLLQECFSLQGKSERIKNFPYPRQYATLSHLFVWVFILFVPFAVVPEFAGIGENVASSWPRVGSLFIWTAAPFCAAISWVFHTMERIGRAGENPFEGTANDVPISTISRGIEIDLREALGESDQEIPKPHPEILSIQM